MHNPESPTEKLNRLIKARPDPYPSAQDIHPALGDRDAELDLICDRYGINRWDRDKVREALLKLAKELAQKNSE